MKSFSRRRSRPPPLPLRIAFDIDGVLADMEGELIRHAEILFGRTIAPRASEGPVESVDAESARTGQVSSDEPQAEPKSPPITASDATSLLARLNLTSREERRLWRHVAEVEGFWENLAEIEPGTVARLGALAAERRWEVIFLTKRPETRGATPQVQTHRWLQTNGFPEPSVFVVQGSRGRIAAALALDTVVDDRPENCLDVVTDSKARAILVWRAEEKSVPAAARRLGIGVVTSAAKCLDVLVEMDAVAPERHGVVDRVMKMLGLREPPATAAKQD